MKIITKNAVYVQRNDMGFLEQTDLSIPASIFKKAFCNGVSIINDDNRYEFIKFEEQSEIEFFKKLDWIIDYGSLKDLEEQKIMELGQKIVEQQKEIATKYNAMSDEECEKNANMVTEYENLGFKILSLRDLVWFNQGELHFDLPADINYEEICNNDGEKLCKKNKM